MGDDVQQLTQQAVSEASPADGSLTPRGRFRAAVHVIQATHRWQRQTQDARSGQPWPELVRYRDRHPCRLHLCRLPPVLFMT